MRVTAKEARERFRELLDRAERGEEVVILRRGKPVVRLTRARPARGRHLPDLGDFRASIQVRGAPLSEMVNQERKEAR